MSDWMIHLLYSSLSASLLIAVVLVLRAVLAKYAPRWIACLLWGLVGVRLLVPISIESEFSVLPEIELSGAESETESADLGNISEESFGESITESAESVFDAESVTSKEEVSQPTPSAPSMEESVDASVSNTTDESAKEETADVSDTSEESDDETTETSRDTSSDTSVDESEGFSEDTTVSTLVAGTESTPADDSHDKSLGELIPIVWACGAGAMALYAAIQYVLLRRRVSVFSPCEDGVRRCESIDTPFVLGFFHPRIYLPCDLEEDAKRYVVAHERAHIRRLDNWSKLLAFLALTVHWFNPLAWLAFVLLCRDIEYACDEKVMRTLDAEERKAYARALLACAIRK